MQKANRFLRRKGTNLILAVFLIYVNSGKKELQKKSNSRRSELAQAEGGKAVASIRKRSWSHPQGSTEDSQEAVEAYGDVVGRSHHFFTICLCPLCHVKIPKWTSSWIAVVKFSTCITFTCYKCKQLWKTSRGTGCKCGYLGMFKSLWGGEKGGLH